MAIIDNPTIKRLAEAFRDADRELYLVGGVVRDLLMGRRDSKDIDMTTDATPDEIERIVKSTNPQHVNIVGKRFGTIAVLYSHFPVIEITTYRSETYTDDSRNPEVTFGTSLQEDFRRRDFTVNAIAMNALTGTFVDTFGGRDDIVNNVIEVVDEEVECFEDDPLRILRAIRFAAQLDFIFDDFTENAIFKYRHLLKSKKLSQERIRDEFMKMLVLPGPQVTRAMNMLYDLSLLDKFLPEIAALKGVTQPPHHEFDVFDHTMAVVAGVEDDPILRLAALFHDVGKPQTRSVEEKDGKEITHFYEHEDVGAQMVLEIMDRLRFPQRIAEIVSKMIKMHMRFNAYDKDWSNKAVRNLYLDAGNQFHELMKLSIADTSSDTGIPHSIAEARVLGLYGRVAYGIMEDIRQNPIVCPVDGNELMAHFGRPSGPWIKPIKEQLMQMVKNGELGSSEKDRALHLAEQWMNEES